MRIQEFVGDIPRMLAEELIASPRIAVDTETTGLDWRRDRLALCQIFAPTTGPVLVHVSEARAENVASVFRSVAVKKVFHFAPFDLRFIASGWGFDVANVSCTKAGAKLLEPGLDTPEYSLAAVLARHVGVFLEKGAVRTSDWEARSLSAEQSQYAVGDVTHLLDLDELLRSKLATVGREPLLDAVCRYMPVDARLELDGIANPLTY